MVKTQTAEVQLVMDLKTAARKATKAAIEGLDATVRETTSALTRGLAGAGK